ncbi:metallopeptidase family protein [Pseudohalocynthiibacter aestuariivivens]|nr:metallopeptidase family protein [Pseudohalocynthiibacter aestuariivivens]QIE45577.1 metallopeptidase family protein [Pseudohalocynthiibacter aestuariivivens]
MDPTAADIDRIETIARATIAELPATFRAASASVLLRVEAWPHPQMLRDLCLKNPAELTGLYEGIPMTEKSVSYPAPYPDQVWLFAGPILIELDDRNDVTLNELVAHVTVHEFAHHFGWSDDDIAMIDRWWE